MASEGSDHDSSVVPSGEASSYDRMMNASL